MSVPRKYGLLRAIATVLKVLGVIALLLGLVGMVWVLATGNSGAALDALGTASLPSWIRTTGAALLPLIGLVWFIQLFAFGSILSLLINIEENTRALALPQD